MKAILARDIARRRRVMDAAVARHMDLAGKAERMLRAGNAEMAEAYAADMERNERIVCRMVSEIFALGG
jgi:hypothetical protein